MSALLEMRNVHKRYPGVHALKGISFSLEEGEFHALVGENGAGKSTLIKTLGGVVPPDEGGEILVRGERVAWSGPGDALRAGVGIIHQELSLAPHLSVAQNIFLGRELRRGVFVDSRRMREMAKDLLAHLRCDIDPDRTAGELSTGEQQLVEIAKALSQKVSILALDEPTSSLSARETENLFRVIDDLKSRGVGIIYISHRLEEIFAHADRVTVLRDGEVTGRGAIGDFDPSSMVACMVGRRVEVLFPRSFRDPGEVLLEVRGISRRGVLRDVSFELREGEIVGVAGLVGSGRTETARCLVGLDPVDGGEVNLVGGALALRGPRETLDRGMVLVPEDRKRQGLFLNRSIRDNATVMELLHGLRRGPFVDREKRDEAARRHVRNFSVKCRDIFDPVFALSGGNQQKVAIAKGLAVAPRVLILDEPTRGVDVGARAEIHEIMNDLVHRGMGILMISSDLPEVLGMSDRVLVFRHGGIAASFDRGDATGEKVMLAAAGGGVHGG
ncbi:MAG TPA: sugar ABC transporter ATP-binding protein [Synergistaceae bacterium]|nr:sugar ABC transporter ATP-binding protein [Synergistaceae bacterium]HQH78187.1 sugar ABC transporter ATP-binding protein [Synergistaceae bacterium]HQK24920.1 sugar ABC transporter ATP-binding protein [Synergistaceae bacterium]